jgi:hypothetical protein
MSDKYCNSWKSNNFKERLETNQRADTKKKKKKQIRGAIEKSPILLSQYWKNQQLNSAITNSHF